MHATTNMSSSKKEDKRDLQLQTHIRQAAWHNNRPPGTSTGDLLPPKTSQNYATIAVEVGTPVVVVISASISRD